jgi:Amt family ammonium transporter
MPNGGAVAFAELVVLSALVPCALPALALLRGARWESAWRAATAARLSVVIPLLGLQWLLIGYLLVVGPDLSAAIRAFILPSSARGLEPGSGAATTFIVFQTACALVAPVLLVCAVATRIKASAAVTLAILWSTFVYDPVAYFVCRQGGGAYVLGVVAHLAGAWSALVCGQCLDRRRHVAAEAAARPLAPATWMLVLSVGCIALTTAGRSFEGTLGPHALESFVLTAVGGGVGWLVSDWGWDRAGQSTLWSRTAGLVALIAVTAAGGCFVPQTPVTIGFVVSSAYHRIQSGSAAATMAGLLAVVEATAGGDVVPSTVLTIALVAGTACYLAVRLRHRIGRLLHLDPVPLHALAGSAGLLLGGCLARRGAGVQLADLAFAPRLAWYAVACIGSASYCGAATLLLLRFVDATVGLRPVNGTMDRASVPTTATTTA